MKKALNTKFGTFVSVSAWLFPKIQAGNSKKVRSFGEFLGMNFFVFRHEKAWFSSVLLKNEPENDEKMPEVRKMSVWEKAKKIAKRWGCPNYRSKMIFEKIKKAQPQSLHLCLLFRVKIESIQRIVQFITWLEFSYIVSRDNDWFFSSWV